MRHSRGYRRRTLLIVGLLAGVLAIWVLCEPDPAERFRAITGRELPAGVQATAYGKEMNDNLFHTTHYWLLSGSPAALRQVTEGTGFEESLDDARWVVPDMQRLFGVALTREDVVAGYEWEIGRDRWFCIFGDGTRALYAH